MSGSRSNLMKNSMFNSQALRSKSANQKENKMDQVIQKKGYSFGESEINGKYIFILFQKILFQKLIAPQIYNRIQNKVFL